MNVFHGSNVVVQLPRILQSERMLDFGTGFYTTSNKEQAVRWAEIVCERRKPKNKILSVYEFDLEAAECELTIIRFNEPSAAWLDFVCDNRSGREHDALYDIVIGPVANDKVYTVVQYYENGVYDKEDAIKRLKVDALYDQILFHTTKSLEFCHYVGSVELGAGGDT
ncbi:MAG: DUF3990 domain-containing protein [Oscillospiraceae bacterium]|nr:DUF3990 domain-containing protein [Oscillospiraceae bacterium]